MRIILALATVVATASGALGYNVLGGKMLYEHCRGEALDDTNVIAFVQTELKKRGYAVKVDGKTGPATSDAIRAFHIKNGGPLVDRIDRSLLEELMSAEEYSKFAKERSIKMCERYLIPYPDR